MSCSVNAVRATCGPVAPRPSQTLRPIPARLQGKFVRRARDAALLDCRASPERSPRLPTARSTNEVIEGLLADLRRARLARANGRPFVTLAYAQSLDGSIALEAGRPFALSGAE